MGFFFQGFPVPASAALGAVTVCWVTGQTPRCQEGARAGAGTQDAGWNSMVIPHPAVPRPMTWGQCHSQSCDKHGVVNTLGGGVHPEQGPQHPLNKLEHVAIIASHSGRNGGAPGAGEGGAVARMLFQPQPHSLGMKMPGRPASSRAGMQCSPGLCLLGPRAHSPSEKRPKRCFFLQLPRGFDMFFHRK